MRDVKTLLKESVDEDIDVQLVYAEILALLDDGLEKSAQALPGTDDRRALLPRPH